MCLSLEQSVGTSAANAIVDLFGTPVTENERGWLDEICDAFLNTDPRLTARSRSALRGIFGKMTDSIFTTPRHALDRSEDLSEHERLG